MKDKATKKNNEELKDRKIDEDVLKDVAGGRLFEPPSDAKSYKGGLSKKKK